jgi:hypothetical protein
LRKKSLLSLPTSNARVLDYGAGEALHADLVAAASGELLLCEAGPGLRTSTKRLFAAAPKIRVLAPQELTELSKHSLDLIILHSVAQYLPDAEVNTLLALFHRLLKSEGHQSLKIAVAIKLQWPSQLA